MIALVPILPSDIDRVMQAALNFRPDEIRRTVAIAKALRLVASAALGLAEAWCPICEGPFENVPTIVVAEPFGVDLPERMFALPVCINCAPTPVAAREAATAVLRRLWPALRWVTVHRDGGRA